MRRQKGNMLTKKRQGKASSRRKSAGFTLIEIMIVVVILGILAGVVVVNVVGEDDKARVIAATADLRVIAQGLERYKLDNYRYPSSDAGLSALIEKPEEARNWKQGGYVRSLNEDPWGNPYVYDVPGRGGQPFELLSFGADGVEGGEGFNADIRLSDI